MLYVYSSDSTWSYTAWEMLQIFLSSALSFPLSQKETLRQSARECVARVYTTKPKNASTDQIDMCITSCSGNGARMHRGCVS